MEPAFERIPPNRNPKGSLYVCSLPSASQCVHRFGIEHENHTAMNHRYTLPAACALALGLFLVAPGLAQVDDCNFTYTLTTGCSADGTGWATVSNITSKAGPFSIHWNGAEAAGGNTITGLGDGEYFVTVFDIGQCGVVQTFTIDCGEQEGNGCIFRTQTQGGWGTQAHGNNPGAYRDANFSNAFPNGLEIGCTNKLRLTNSAAVAAFLPSGSNARPLNTGTMVNPGRSYRNVLAGQLVALSLSVGFDTYDPGFGASNGLLANAVVQSGTFQGWTVQMVLDEANQFIGGCASQYSASQLNAVLSAINENFVDGNTDNGFLGCEGSKSIPASGTDRVTVHVHPNPATDRLTVLFPSDPFGPTTLSIYDIRGGLVRTLVVPAADSNEQRLVVMDLDGMPNGSYILAVDQLAHRQVRQLVVAR